MTLGAFDALARHTGAPQDRRTSLKALGTAGLAAALTAPLATEAKNKKKCKKKVQQKCESQQGGCQAAVVEFCEGNTGCEEVFLECCEFLATCNAEAAVACIIDGLTVT